jgi:hypothetical protein
MLDRCDVENRDTLELLLGTPAAPVYRNNRRIFNLRILVGFSKKLQNVEREIIRYFLGFQKFIARH